MPVENEIVIISACRTPVGKFQGSLSDLSATQLGAIAVREAVKKLRAQQLAIHAAIFRARAHAESLIHPQVRSLSLAVLQKLEREIEALK